MKKLLFASLALCITCSATFAQQRTVEKSFMVKQGQKIGLNLKFGKNITIKSWEKNEVAFKAAIKINGGKLNNALKLDFDDRSGQLHIISDYDQEVLKAGRREDCPDSDYSRFSWNDGDGRYVVCSDISYELFVPQNVDLHVKTISGNIEVVDVTGPIRAKSISGYVDLSWPSGKPAHFAMKTISGEAFTGLDQLKFINKKDHIPLVGYKIKADLGNGGPTVSLESISGNIYLRKGKS